MNITIASSNPKMENDQNMYLYLKRLNFLKKLVQYSVEETHQSKPFRGRSTGSRFSRSLVGTTPDINKGESRFRDMYTAFQ
mmetsp:Transcript_17202/g.2841  ORF Transcript_17202/g.2841 Transcript_17202/m.2841 type:complete len:81 (+) Transcript_17202:1384-1626(+)